MLWRETQPPRFSVAGRQFWTPCSLLFNRMALAVLNWGLIQQAGEKCSAKVPFLAWQLRSHHKGATNCQMEIIHLFLDHCLIYSVTVQNKPAPFLLPPSCAWKVRWKWNTVLDSPAMSGWGFFHTLPNYSWACWVSCTPTLGIQEV